MKNKTMLFISLVLIAFLIATSYNPQVVQAEEQAPETELFVTESPVTNLQKWETLKLELDDIPMASHRMNFFSIPGVAFTAHYSSISWYNAGGGCMASTQVGDNPAKTFIAPVTIPYNSLLGTVYVKYYNFVENPATMLVRIYRTHYSEGITQRVGQWEVQSPGTGFHITWNVLSDHKFDSSFWAYWAEFILPSGNQVGLCHFQIAFQEPIANPFASAMPIIHNKK